MRREDSAEDSESSDHDSWNEDSTLATVEPFTRDLRKRNPAPAPAEDEEGLLVESITVRRTFFLFFFCVVYLSLKCSRNKRSSKG